MGFWDTVKELGGVVKSSLDERRERIQGYMERYSEMDDDMLLHIYRNSSLSADQRFAIARVIQQRGYNPDE